MSRKPDLTDDPTGDDDVWRDAVWRDRIRRRLRRWFARNARDLPWRRNTTPYRVWVSEIMLQQTQVATVIPYYRRFLKAFPSVKSLAKADEQELLALWEGLGYYRRARSMHAAARVIVHEHGGRFPTAFDDVLALPGIGRYTAGAVLSIARNQRLPILEGNTQRVFSRWTGLPGNPSDTSVNKTLWTIAESMLPRKDPGEFNQAAMELGALVCTPKNPNCDRCPVAELCVANIEGLQSKIPGKLSRMQYEDRTEFAFLVAHPDEDNPSYLMHLLPEGVRWSGLWDFPRSNESAADSIDAAADDLGRQIGVPIVPRARLMSLRHGVTKYRISLQVHVARLRGSTSEVREGWRFVDVGDMAALAMSVTGRKIADALARQHNSVV